MKNELHFGIMCSSHHLSTWEGDCVNRLLADKRIKLKLIILDDPQNYSHQSKWKKIIHFNFKTLFFVLYNKLFFKPFAKRKADFSDLFSNIPSLTCKIVYKGKYSQYFSIDDINCIKQYELDFVLRFGFNIIRGDILTVAKFGVWSFHHDDEMKYRGGPPCFWEIFNGDPETGTILQKLTNQLDGGVVLKKGLFRTKNHSYKQNINQAYMESSKWPYWVCKDIFNGTYDYIDKDPTSTIAPIYKYPSNAEFVKFVGILFLNKLRKIHTKLFLMQKWNVALVNMEFNSFVTERASVDTFSLPFKNAYTFNADAFGLKSEGNLFVYFEELDYTSSSQKGRIKVFDCSTKTSQYLFPEDHIHRSYPFIFYDNQEVYMIPEEGETGKISLYKAIQLPDQWEKVATLMEGTFFIDPSLVKYNDRYWLFYTKNSDEFDGDTHLHIAYADKLTGPYQEHIGNPVKISIRSARPAGGFFIATDGSLIRPSQNSSRTYGGSIVLNKIVTLSDKLFEEVELKELKSPDEFYKDGLHTINIIDEQRVLIDMKKNLFKWDWFFRTNSLVNHFKSIF